MKVTGESPKRKLHKTRRSSKRSKRSEKRKKKFLSDNLNYLLGAIFEELHLIFENQELEIRENEIRYSRNPNFNFIGYLKDSFSILRKKVISKVMEISTSRSMRQMYSTERNPSQASFNMVNRQELLSHNFSSIFSVNKKINDSGSYMLDYTRSGIDLMNSFKNKPVRKMEIGNSNNFRSIFF